MTDSNNEGREKLSRRAVLRGAAVAMPVVLTLQSGSALARSSNLISEAPAGTTDSEGNTLCLDTNTVYAAGDGMKYDLGEPPYAAVNVIPQQDYYIDSNKSSAPVWPDTMCNNGGTYFYQNSGWQEARLPTNGIVVSATAITSVLARGQILLNRIA